MNYKEINSILFVCMGNICRSPSAEAVFRHKAKQKSFNLLIDSAGTTGAHAKQKPDVRAKKVGVTRGYSFDNIKARKVSVADFEKFDLILAMDKQNVRELLTICPPHLTDKVVLFLEFANNFEEDEVPDPYYGGAGGFKLVLDMVEDASDGLLAKMS